MRPLLNDQAKAAGGPIDRKTCTACGKRQSAAAFNDSAATADGLARLCRVCINARRRQRDRAGVKNPRGHARTTILATALRKGDISTVRKLVRAGMVQHCDWVCETMREGHLKLAQALLKLGVARNIYSMAAMADVKGLTRRLHRLPADARLAASMEPASDRVTPLHVACASDWRSHGYGCMTAQVQTAMVLFEYGADLHAVARYRGIDEVEPLFCACWSSGNLALVRWLLDHGALPTDAHLAAALGHLQRHGRGAYDIAEALLGYGLAVDGPTHAGRTPLQSFAHQADYRAVAWLIAHGADVNARSLSGRTAAHFAAERNTGPKTLALLVENGADLSVRDDDGQTPLEIAKLNDKPRLIEWIAKRVRARNR